MESGGFLGILFFHSQKPEINLLGIWTSRNVGIREQERNRSAAKGLGHCAAIGTGKASLTMGNYWVRWKTSLLRSRHGGSDKGGGRESSRGH